MVDRPRRYLIHRLRRAAAAVPLTVALVAGVQPAAPALAAVHPVKHHVSHMRTATCSPRCKKCLPPIC